MFTNCTLTDLCNHISGLGELKKTHSPCGRIERFFYSTPLWSEGLGQRVLNSTFIPGPTFSISQLDALLEAYFCGGSATATENPNTGE